MIGHFKANITLSLYFIRFFSNPKILWRLEVDVHIENKYFKCICYFTVSFSYTPNSNICLYLHVAMATIDKK